MRSTSRTPMSIRAIGAFKVSRSGGVFRYSMTVGAMPLARISASVLRDVPQSGLW